MPLKQIIRKASLAYHNLCSFQKRPNISLYVEYSRNLILFFEDFKFAYKRPLNFTQNDSCATSDKNMNFNSSKKLLRKVDFQIFYAEEQLS